MASTGSDAIGDSDACVLLDDFGKFIQLLAAVIAFSVLVVKRHLEKPRRPWSIWGLDVGKQATSGLGAHFVGLITATLVAGATVGISPCSWYFVAFTVDVTLGVTISLVIFHFGQQMAHKYNYVPLRSTGNYGQVIDHATGIVTKKPSMRIWAIQMAFFTFVCVVPARFVCLIFTYTLRNQLSGVAQWVHSGFIGKPHAELMFVMVAGPCFMNAVQFLIQDSVLKLHKRRAAAGAMSPSAAADAAAMPGDEQDNGLMGDTETCRLPWSSRTARAAPSPRASTVKATPTTLSPWARPVPAALAVAVAAPRAPASCSVVHVADEEGEHAKEQDDDLDEDEEEAEAEGENAAAAALARAALGPDLDSVLDVASS